MVLQPATCVVQLKLVDEVALPAKALPAKAQQKAVKKPLDKHSARVAQYTAQLILPVVDKCIDDVQYENYNIPNLMFGSRVIVQADRMHNLGEHKEHEFVDARIEKTFQQITRPFAEIKNDDDALRLTFINEQLSKLVANKPVSDKLMRHALTVEQMQVYLESVDTPVHASEVNYGDGMPEELHAYNIMLRNADFQYNKFDKMSLQQVRGRKFKHGVVAN